MSKKLLQYKTAGSGEKTVVFLHGFLESMDIWDNYVSILSTDFFCVQLDLPGHGHSGSQREIESMTHMADEVFKVLDHLNIHSFSIVGHSMGGYVAIEMLRKSPQAVLAICLLNSHAESDSDQKKQDRNRVVEVINAHYQSYLKEVIPNLFADETRGRLEDKISELIKKAESCDPKGIAAATKGMRDRRSNVEFLKSYADRLHYIAGSEDSVLSVHEVVRQVETINCSCDIIDGAGHMCFLEEPSLTLRYIHTFLQK